MKRKLARKLKQIMVAGPTMILGGRGGGRGRGGRGRGRGNLGNSRGNGTQGQGGGGNRTQYFEGYCNNCGVWGHKSNNYWHKQENAHLRNASYRPLKNQEATGANVEIVLPSIELGSEEELYCTQVEMESKIEVYCKPCAEESENFKESQGSQGI